jgi:hypothetical protein
MARRGFIRGTAPCHATPPITRIIVAGIIVAGIIVECSGTYVFPVKASEKTLKDNIETAFTAPVFLPSRWDSGVEKTHGRIERRMIVVLSAKAARIACEWPSAKSAASGVDGGKRRTGYGKSRKKKLSISSPA